MATGWTSLQETPRSVTYSNQEPSVLLSHQNPQHILRYSFQIQGITKANPNSGLESLSYRPLCLSTSRRGRRVSPSPLLWPTPLAGNLTSCKMPEGQGVGDGEAKGLCKSALNAPTWLPRASHCLASSLPLFPGKLKPPTQTLKTQISLLIRYKQWTPWKIHIQPSFPKEFCTKCNMPLRGLFKWTNPAAKASTSIS